jgi:hypothetical protein
VVEGLIGSGAAFGEKQSHRRLDIIRKLTCGNAEDAEAAFFQPLIPIFITARVITQIVHLAIHLDNEFR